MEALHALLSAIFLTGVKLREEKHWAVFVMHYDLLFFSDLIFTILIQWVAWFAKRV